MLSTFNSIGSILLRTSGIATNPNLFIDVNLNELEYFPATSTFTSNEALPGGGAGVNASGTTMIFGRITSSTNSGLILYSNDSGLNWYSPTHPATTAIGSLYFRDGTYVLASGAPSAGMQPFICSDLSTSSSSFSSITSALSVATRTLCYANNATSSSGYAYFGYQGFFRMSNNLGLNTTVTMSNHPAYNQGCTDMDIDPDNALYGIISSTTTTLNTGLYVTSPGNNKVAIITGLSALILSVSTSSGLSNTIIQTTNNTYRITNLNLSNGTCTISQLSNGTILPTNCGVGSIGSQSCKASMSLNGNVICVIDMNNAPVGKAYYSTDGGSTFKCINTEFSLTNKIFISCCVSRGSFGGVSNTNYIVLLSTTGIYRLKLSSTY